MFITVKGELKCSDQTLDPTSRRCVHGYSVTNEAVQRRLGETMGQYINTLRKRINGSYIVELTLWSDPFLKVAL